VAGFICGSFHQGEVAVFEVLPGRGECGQGQAVLLGQSVEGGGGLGGVAAGIEGDGQLGRARLHLPAVGCDQAAQLSGVGRVL